MIKKPHSKRKHQQGPHRPHSGQQRLVNPLWEAMAINGRVARYPRAHSNSTLTVLFTTINILVIMNVIILLDNEIVYCLI